MPAAAGTNALTREALEALYRRLERPVYNVVLRWLWDPEESRDVVQEAFVRLWRKRAEVRMETVEALVYRVAINLARNRRRSRRLWRWTTLETTGERADTAEAADRSLERSEDRARVRAAIDALPERLRRVIALTELAGLSYAVVGEILGVPPGTVGSRRHAALAALRRHLEDGT